MIQTKVQISLSQDANLKTKIIEEQKAQGKVLVHQEESKVDDKLTLFFEPKSTKKLLQD